KYLKHRRFWIVKKKFGKAKPKPKKLKGKTYIVVALFITNESRVVNGRVATYIFRAKNKSLFIKKRLKILLYKDTEFLFYSDNPDNIYQKVFVAENTKANSYLISKLPVFIHLEVGNNEDAKLIKKFDRIQKAVKGVEIEI
ncbi:MAG: hypothetical protein QW478_06680, partial [Candidatus Micrarchaeaceae archaeon]